MTDKVGDTPGDKMGKKIVETKSGTKCEMRSGTNLQQSEKQVGDKEAKWETGKGQNGKQSGRANYIMQGSAALTILTTSFGPDTTAEFPLTHMTFPCSCKCAKARQFLFSPAY